MTNNQQVQTHKVQHVNVTLSKDYPEFQPKLSQESVEFIKSLTCAVDTYYAALADIDKNIEQNLSSDFDNQTNIEHNDVFAPLDFN